MLRKYLQRHPYSRLTCNCWYANHILVLKAICRSCWLVPLLPFCITESRPQNNSRERQRTLLLGYLTQPMRVLKKCKRKTHIQEPWGKPHNWDLRKGGFRAGTSRSKGPIHNFLLRWIPSQTCGYVSTLILGWHPLPSWLPRSLPAHVETRKSSVTSGVGTLSLYFIRNQLLPLALSLEYLDENKISVLLHLTNTSHPVQGLGSSISYFKTTEKKKSKNMESLRTNLILLNMRHTKLLMCLYIPFCELLIYSFCLFFLGYSICMVFHIIYISLSILLG